MPVVAHLLNDLNSPARLKHTIQKANFWDCLLGIMIFQLRM
jgi:hypothetical protein